MKAFFVLIFLNLGLIYQYNILIFYTKVYHNDEKANFAFSSLCMCIKRNAGHSESHCAIVHPWTCCSKTGRGWWQHHSWQLWDYADYNTPLVYCVQLLLCVQ
jgi:hypothetical protein